MLAPAMSAVPKAIADWQARLADVLSVRYALLRGWTAGSALVAGLVQTFVFARVLSPEQFSLFILVGAVGVSMWLFDLGLSKILFVRMRKHYLAGESTLGVGAQANAVALFYALAITVFAAICFAAMLARPGETVWGAAEFALFFFPPSILRGSYCETSASPSTNTFISRLSRRCAGSCTSRCCSRCSWVCLFPFS